MIIFPTVIISKGISYFTQLPISSNCEGLEGKAYLTCDDGRKVDCVWKATACGKAATVCKCDNCGDVRCTTSGFLGAMGG